MPQIGPVKYVVMCCTDSPLGWIDDLRPIGGDVRVRANPAPPYSVARNSVDIVCVRCAELKKKRPNARMLAQKNAARVCDRLNPVRHQILEEKELPIPQLPTAPAELLPAIPERRHVIPLEMLELILGTRDV